jgi:hypothetical protein
MDHFSRPIGVRHKPPESSHLEKAYTRNVNFLKQVSFTQGLRILGSHEVEQHIGLFEVGHDAHGFYAGNVLSFDVQVSKMDFEPVKHVIIECGEKFDRLHDPAGAGQRLRKLDQSLSALHVMA